MRFLYCESREKEIPFDCVSLNQLTDIVLVFMEFELIAKIPFLDNKEEKIVICSNNYYDL